MGAYRYTLTHATEGTLVLTKDPNGWQNASRVLSRDMKYHGVFKQVGIDLEFHCSGGGKEFIDDIYDTYGVNETVELLIEYRCDASDDYETDFDGKINYKSYLSKKSTTTVNVEQNDSWSLLQSRWNTKIDIQSGTTLDGTSIGLPTLVDFNFHNRKVKFLGKMEITSPIAAGITSQASVLGAVNSQEYYAEIPYSVIVDDLGTAQVPITNGLTSNYINTVNTSTQDVQQDHTFQALFDGTYNIGVDLDFDYAGTLVTDTNFNLDFTIDLVIIATMTPNNIQQPFLRILTIANIATVTGQTVDFNNNYTYSNTFNHTLYDGEYVFIGLYINSDVSDDVLGQASLALEYNTAEITYNITDSSLATTTGKALPIFETWAAISQRILDNASAFTSTYFGRENSSPTGYPSNGCGGFNIITTGKAIRGFPIADHPISISFGDMWDGCAPMFNLGVGIEPGFPNTVRMERMEYFYDDTTTVLQLSNVNDIERNLLPDHFFSNVKVGYAKWESEDVSGIREFNNQHDYSIPFIKIFQNTLNLISTFITGGYPIEFTRRRQYGDESTEDYKYDNDIFLIATNRSVDGSGNPVGLTEAELDENFTVTTNVFEPGSVYNIRHSLKRVLLRNMSRISPCLTKDGNAELLFTKALGDASIETTDSVSCEESFDGAGYNALLDEDADLSWADSRISDGAPIFLPESIKITHKLDYSDWKLLEANPYGVIEFSRGTSSYEKAFIMKIDYHKEKGMADFTLIKKYV